ncbi:hypothetical protein B566_EDAN009340 [Ephemera danica]|nr:hypothetical protein B566_EDAN009340 [Ephemera danica]
MYIYSVGNKEALYEIIEHELRFLGIKHASKTKKPSLTKKSVHSRTRIFHRPLDQLPCQSVHLHCGAVIQVPCFLVDLCEALQDRLETEGIFRKAGSAVRQREIKAHIEAGGPLLNDFHEIDIANILKLFLRELPEPLLPWNFHEILVKCFARSTEHLLTGCLLLPTQHFNALAYLMQFLHSVTARSSLNLMPATNLAIVLVPALMPVQEAVSKHMDQIHAQQHDAHVHIIQALIEQAEELGRIPENLALQLGLQQAPEEEMVLDEVDRGSMDSLDSLGPDRKSRKRRSGSLTRVLNGIRKFVGGRHGHSPSPEVNLDAHNSPLIMSAKKRKIDPLMAGISAKKKLEVLKSLPESSMLNNCTPSRPRMLLLTPHHTDSPTIRTPSHCYATTPPVCSNPNPQKCVSKSPHPQLLKSKQRSRFFTPLKSRSDRLSFGAKKTSKKQKPMTELKEENTVRQPPKRKKSWSSLGGSWGRSMRRLAPVNSVDSPLLNSPYSTRFGGLVTDSDGVDLSPTVPPQVNNFSSEYEEIKNKVSNLENQLNEELSKAHEARLNNTDGHTATFVQSEYERTMEDSEQFNNCQTTEHLAKRLSRELKIRRSGENKVIRSPSARKIGSLRRRSRELSRPILRTSSLGKMMRSPVRCTVPLPAARSLRRGRPNTVLSGLPSPANNLQRPISSSTQSLTFATPNSPTIKPVEFLVPQSPLPMAQTPAKKVGEFLIPQSPFTRSVKRAASFGDQRDNCTQSDMKKAASVDSNISEAKWNDAKTFLNAITPGKHQALNGRPSIVEIKRNRAGMVLAKVKLFDNQPSPTDPNKETCKRQGKPQAISKLKRSLEATNSPQKLSSPKKLVSPKSPAFTMELRTPPRSITKTKPFTPHSDGAKPNNHTPNMQRSKAINSLPRDWLSGKENTPVSPLCLQALKRQIAPQVSLPAGLKDTIYDVCTPRSLRLHAKSPLAVQDVNRIVLPATPQQCPVIKMPLSVRPVVASALRRTPHSLLDTPSRGMRPLQATPLRRSPRLLAMSLSSTPSFQ